MKLLFRLILSMAFLLTCAHAQLTLTGAGKGAVGGGGGGYTGPIDINGTAYAFWSTRCGSGTYSGNIVDIWDAATGSTTETLLGCDGAGNIVVKSGSSLATTCAISCAAKTIYDQSGSNKCSGACDATQSTNANRPLVTTSCLNSKICLVFNGSTPTCLATPNLSAGQSQPFTSSMVLNFTASGNTQSLWYDASSTLRSGNSTAGGDGWEVYAGLEAVGLASINATHAGQVLWNSSSSSWYIDGSLTSGLNAFTVGIGTGSGMGLGAHPDCSGGIAGGNFFEYGIWGGDKTANNSSMNSNQHTYWNF